MSKKITIKEEKPDLLAEIRRRLSSKTGKEYWKSLEEAADAPVFKEFIEREFPTEIEKWSAPMTRRQLLKYMAASFALAGLSACTRQPAEKILPFAKAPEEYIPGKPLYYASAVKHFGVSRGVLVESHMGRPTKVEGNPLHPESTGPADMLMQAAILDLYDPDRSKTVLKEGWPSTWSDFLADVQKSRTRLNLSKGEGLRILTGAISSPTLYRQIQRVLREFPKAHWHHYESAGESSVWEGARLAFGRSLRPLYSIKNADILLAIDSDFLYSGPEAVPHAKAFAERRRPENNKMNRLYVIESALSVTGSNADNRLRAKPSDVGEMVLALASALNIGGLPNPHKQFSTEESRRLELIASDLKSARGRSLVMAGPSQPAHVHAAVYAINASLGNIGRTLRFVAPPELPNESDQDSLKKLNADMKAGRVDTVLMLDVNPVYTAPGNLAFRENLLKVPNRIHVGSHVDETAKLCQWHVPLSHDFESWSDGRAADGTIGVVQPLVKPLYESRTLHEIFSLLIDDVPRESRDIIQDNWKNILGAATFSSKWRQSLHDGHLKGSALALQYPQPSVAAVRRAWPKESKGGLEIAFLPDPSVRDGAQSNNAWLQEVPKPVTKLTWDNAALISPELASELNLENEDRVELTLNGQTVEAPVWVVPGQANETIVVNFGYGRNEVGRIADGNGFNAYSLQSADSTYFQSGVEIKKVGGRWKLAATQLHHSMEGRHLVRSADLDHYKEDPAFAQHMGHDAPADPHHKPFSQSEDYQWGMAIDLNACIGCNACIVGCQAENNIPVVGRDEVRKGREMQWIRVDHYFEGDPAEPKSVHQPVPCMHCEKAPCEPVCPVGATVHSDEGLNDMVYNRCVGTRYCSNNCPYKVRRFNFYHYADEKTEQLKMQRNPDVTVRFRGVMEKCTYCVQRINLARIDAKKSGEPIKDGEVVTACQGTCPAQAITFGNILDPNSAVSKAKKDPRNYALLGELGTFPRTTYAAKVKNPHPKWGGVEVSHHG